VRSSFLAITLLLLAISASLVAVHARAAAAELRLPAIFSDHMVVQAGTPVPVWGWGEPGEQVKVTLAGQSLSARVAADGTWKVRFANLKPQSEPQTMTVTGTRSLTVRDVLVGEVWLCSGQSNMAMTMNRAKDFEKERTTAHLPLIRMFIEGGLSTNTPQRDCTGSWVVCTPETVGRFSATAFFFGREIQRVQGGAVGLINAAVGGTYIEAWISEEAQRATPALAPSFELRDKLIAGYDREKVAAAYRETLEKWEIAAREAKAANKPEPRKPGDPFPRHLVDIDIGGLFNGRIAPLIPFALRGVIWYQGENNATPQRASLYETQLRLLVRDWRARWGAELPFAWVQLPNLVRVESWVHVREAQLKALDLPNTGMAVTIDVGESTNLHPPNKQDVGLRLAQWALGTVYGRKVASSGPLPAGHEIRGGEVVLRFRHTDGGLKAKDGELKSFVIAGEDRQWKPATARIDDDTVIVSSPDVPKPSAVRYAWADDPVCSLYNGAGLPASPFRTDDWPLVPVAGTARAAEKPPATQTDRQNLTAEHAAINPHFPASGPATGSFNGLHLKSKFLQKNKNNEPI